MQYLRNSRYLAQIGVTSIEDGGWDFCVAIRNNRRKIHGQNPGDFPRVVTCTRYFYGSQPTALVQLIAKIKYSRAPLPQHD